MTTPEQNRISEMTFVEHLEELRKRLIVCVIAVGAGAIVSYNFTLPVIRFMIGKAGKLQYLGPADAFMVRIKIALILGVLITAPVLLYQIWAFIAPGLRPVERRYAWPAVFGSIILFYCGATFGVFTVPYSVKVLMSFGGGVLTANYTVDRFLAFASTVILAFGSVFEMPIVFAVLAKLGIVKHKDVAAKRKYYYFGIFVAAAAIMPGDITNMFILAIPLFFLFEFSVLIIRFIRPVTI